MEQKKKINLALQGGGAHGAFTWGVLDLFLEKNIFDFEAISATSAGSMNAIVLAQGLMEGGPDKARELLFNFWHAMSEYQKLYAMPPLTTIDYFIEPYLRAPLEFFYYHAVMTMFSPYQFNPFNFNPVRESLAKIIDFEKIKEKSKIKLFICATNVKTGKIKIFNNDELCIEAILASACLPQLFQAVEMNDEYYWDGGYLGNPAIFPLIYNTKIQDVLILHTVPIVRSIVPQTVTDITTRLREVSFNSSLMREMRAIAFVTKLIDQGWIKDEYIDQLKKIYVHCLRADYALLEYPLSSVYIPAWDFLVKLRNLGRDSASIWLDKHYQSIGKESTVHFEEWL